MRSVAALVLFLLGLVSLLVPTAVRGEKDRTGIAWVRPFSAAREAARKRNRLLLVKPLNEATTSTGDW